MQKELKLANPGPLGLLGFGLTTVLLNLHNAGLIPLSMVIIAMGIAMGGFAQIIAGILEFKTGNTFGGTAFTSYGLFWLSLVIIWLFPKEGLEADKVSMGYYLLLWGIYTAFMFVGTLKHNRTTQVIFGSLALLFILLALGDFTKIELITVVAGYVGIFSGLSAFYGAVAQVVNNEFGKKVLPL
ncbi:MAG: acetate uptake transporter [Acholeplasma sp.]|nr:acetate uptake transporter [Acholeplasma sp.]